MTVAAQAETEFGLQACLLKPEWPCGRTPSAEPPLSERAGDNGFQIVARTLVFGGVLVGAVLKNLIMPEFDSTLLGLSAGTNVFGNPKRKLPTKFPVSY